MTEDKWIVKKSKGISKRDRLVKCVTKRAEESLKQAARQRQDEVMLRKISGEDLLGKEAHYHEECRRQYTKVTVKPLDSKPPSKEDIEVYQAHNEAFKFLSEYIILKRRLYRTLQSPD